MCVCVCVCMCMCMCVCVTITPLLLHLHLHMQVVTPVQTLRFGAMSADGLQVWVTAIVHAMSLKPGEATEPDAFVQATTALY